MNYQSHRTCEAESIPGVSFTILRLSLARRIDLAEKIRAAGLRADFLVASSNWEDRLEAALIERRIDRIYLEWGLVSIDGLAVDGRPAETGDVIANGPEPLTDEILREIKAELSLTPVERKN